DASRPGAAHRRCGRPARRARRQPRADLPKGVPLMITLLKHEVLRTYDKLVLIAGVAVLLSLTGALLAATGWPLLAEVGLVVGVVAVVGLVRVSPLMLTADYWGIGYVRMR